MITKPPRKWLMTVSLMAMALFIFAVYAPALRLMLIHDDAANVTWMNAYNLLTIFGLGGQTGSTGASARPVPNALWIIVRDLYGWYIPALIHSFNIFFHVLNAVLVAALAARLGGFSRWSRVLYATLAGLIFGLFPLSYQAVLWAGAVYHPVMACAGLAAIHACLSAQKHRSSALWLVVLGFVAIALLSHEIGFMVGVAVAGCELVKAWSERRRLHWQPLAIAGIALLYPVLYRLLMPGLWSVPSVDSPIALMSRIGTNAAYFMQGMVSWILILLRPWIGLTPDSPAIVSLIFTVAVLASCYWLWRNGKLMIGVMALGWWAVMLAPALLLTEDYVRFSPRLLYTSAVGVALFWGLVATLTFKAAKPRLVRLLLGVAYAALVAWCVPFIGDRLNETARLTPAMVNINADLRKSNSDARVLLINMPYWNGPTYPAFLLGVEGMPIFQSHDTPAWTWLATVSGVRREMSYVRHDISLTRNDRFNYGIPGNVVDDTHLRKTILRHNLIYRFDYDEPGLRASLLAELRDGTPVPLYTFTHDASRISLGKVVAAKCGDTVQLKLEWGGITNMTEPVAVFVHGYTSDGNQVAVADRDPVDGYLPLDMIPANIIVDELRYINDEAHQVAQLRVGVYSRVTGNRFVLSDKTGTRLDGDELIIVVAEGAALCRWHD